MGLVFNMFSKKKKLKAIIVLPSKNVEMFNVGGGERQFTQKIGDTKKFYTIDEKAIYFFKGQPMLFYHHGCSSPVMFNDIGELSFSLSSDEMSSLAESKAIQDLLTAAVGDDKRDMLFYITVANAIASVVILLIVTGVVKIGG